MEFIVLVGVVIVIAIVTFYAYSTNVIFPTYVPQGVAQEQKLVGDAVTNIGRQGADTAIMWIEQQGGYVVPDLNNSVVFASIAVPYWQKCDDTSMKPTLAEIAGRLENAVKNYMNYSLREKTEYFSKNVTFGFDQISVSANILDNRVDFSVNLPTTVQGHAIQQPYLFSVPTKLGEIYEFGSDYAEDAAQNRYLELFVLSSMYFSNRIHEGGEVHPELPTTDVLVKCGERIERTPDEISDTLEGIIEYTLVNTIWWEPFPTDNSQPKTYSIESLGGKKYQQLDPLFYLPDGFDIPISSGIHITNPSPLLTSRVLTTGGLCVGTYQVMYSLGFPVIVRVHDELTGHDFNFATLQNINEMMPGECGSESQSEICVYSSDSTGGSMECTQQSSEIPGIMGCTDANCPIAVTVVRPDGSGGTAPVENASVIFGSCLLGKTGPDGKTEGLVTCEEKDMYIYHYPEGYTYEDFKQQFYRKCSVAPGSASGQYTVYDEYANVTVELYQQKLTRVQQGFQTVVVRGPRVPTTHEMFLTFKSGKCEDYADNVIIDQHVLELCGTGDTDLCLAATRAADKSEKVSIELQPGAYELEAQMLRDDRIIGSAANPFVVDTTDKTVSITVEYWG